MKRKQEEKFSFDLRCPETKKARSIIGNEGKENMWFKPRVAPIRSVRNMKTESGDKVKRLEHKQNKERLRNERRARNDSGYDSGSDFT